MFERTGHGVYSLREAGRLTGVTQPTLRSWFTTTARRRHSAFQSDYAPVQGTYAISFLDLVDARVAASLRQMGMSMQRIREVYGVLRADLEERHPFARQELLYDGAKNIWLHAMGTAGQDQYIEVLKRQQGIPSVVRPFLQSLVYNQTTRLAQEWRVAPGVSIHPEFCYGKPATAKSRRPTRMLAASWHANREDTRAVADWYGVDPDEVTQAVDFEERLAA